MRFLHSLRYHKQTFKNSQTNVSAYMSPLYYFHEVAENHFISVFFYHKLKNIYIHIKLLGLIWPVAFPKITFSRWFESKCPTAT